LAARLVELEGKSADSNGHVEDTDGAAPAEPVKVYSTSALRAVKTPPVCI
jgi:hypothetical protein